MAAKDENQLHFSAADLDPIETQKLLTGGVAPRPIALVSTVSKEGRNNLSPFSFFNAFGSNPPMVAFSPARRGRDGSLKDTYRNLVETKECVIQVVTFDMVEQVNTASGEYPPDIDEFQKSGLTPVDSLHVKPKRVKESPFQMECELQDMIHLGESNGSGNLALCRVIHFHVSKSILTDGKIDPRKVDHVGRNGAAVYTRAFGDALFDLPMPRGNLGVGFENIPEFVNSSNLFTKNDLGKLANTPNLPTKDEVDGFRSDPADPNLNSTQATGLSKAFEDPKKHQGKILKIAKEALDTGQTTLAWKILLAAHS